LRHVASEAALEKNSWRILAWKKHARTRPSAIIFLAA
jgi:hypothetical protein